MNIIIKIIIRKTGDGIIKNNIKSINIKAKNLAGLYKIPIRKTIKVKKKINSKILKIKVILFIPF